MEAVRSPAEAPVVAVVGGGFSGSAVAAAVLSVDPAARAVVFDPSPRAPRGPAYDARSLRRLLNVPAGAMSADPERPADFVDWLRARGAPFGADDYAPRALYGDYLAERDAAARSAAGPRRTDVRAAVRDVRRLPRGFELATADATFRADAVVLATGTPGHASPDCWPAGGAADPRCVEDPRRFEPGPELPEGVALVFGSGLTTVDVALDWTALSPRNRVVAVSRRGLLPRPHVKPFPPAADPATFGAAALVGLPARAVVARVVAAARRAGDDWRRVVGALRPVTDAVFAAWSAEDRRRFLRHALPFWNVHRHRAAPEVAARLGALRAEGRFELVAGRVAAVEGVGGNGPLRARIARRDGAGLELDVALCVNGAGPDYDLVRGGDPLFTALFDRGLARPGPLSSGLDVDADGRVRDARGGVRGDLFAVGALRVGAAFETTAVPELRRQAAAVARLVAAAFGGFRDAQAPG